MDECMKSWKSMRDKFVRELKKVKFRKTGEKGLRMFLSGLCLVCYSFWVTLSSTGGMSLLLFTYCSNEVRIAARSQILDHRLVHPKKRSLQTIVMVIHLMLEKGYNS